MIFFSSINNILSTIRKMGLKNFVVRFFDSRLRNIYFYKGSYWFLNKSAKIDVSGCLAFNMSYSPNNPAKSYIVMREKSKLEVGDFVLFSGADIRISANAHLKLGTGYINHNAYIACFNKIEIGDNVAIGEYVIIRDSDNHNMIYDSYEMSKPIKIESNVWIGMRATILKGVTIGEGCVIAAGSVVTRNIPAYSLAAGSPAKVIKSNVRWE